MNHSARFSLILLATLLAACSKAPEGNMAQPVTQAIDYDRNVGWLHGNCLAILNPELPAGSMFTVVVPGVPQRVSSAAIVGRAYDGETCMALLEDRRQVNEGSGYSFYRVDARPEVNLGIAMLGTAGRLDDYAFDACNTTEGVVFSLKALPQAGGATLWRGYYYLGYDTEPNCPVPSQ